MRRRIECRMLTVFSVTFNIFINFFETKKNTFIERNLPYKYSNHLNTTQVWYLNGPNVSNGGLKTRQEISVLWSNMFGFRPRDQTI